MIKLVLKQYYAYLKITASLAKPLAQSRTEEEDILAKADPVCVFVPKTAGAREEQQ